LIEKDESEVKESSLTVPGLKSRSIKANFIIYPPCRVVRFFEPGKPGGVPHGNFNLLLTGEHDFQIQIKDALL
jgi:hypothetical protein